MRALIVSGYRGEPINHKLDAQLGRWPRYELTPAQREVAEPEIHAALVWLGEGVLIEGESQGVDELCRAIAKVHDYGCTVLPMPAQWRKHGKRAGTLRNEAMLHVLRQLRDCGYECRVLCLPGPKSRGTRHMERIARDAEFDVTVQELP